MDFYEVIEQVLALLQQNGRVSYRALKRQFDLDDGFSEDLKDELLHSRLPTDEDGKRFVGVGPTMQGHGEEGIVPMRDWFTESFDTAALQEAKILLAELA
jgi:hypothetical protein